LYADGLFKNEASNNFNDYFAESGAALPRFSARYLGRVSTKRTSVKQIFLSLLPWEYMRTVVIPATSTALQLDHDEPLDESEFLRFLGYILAMTLFSFNRRQDCWSVKDSLLQPAPDFNRFGITYHRFEAIISCLRFGIGDESVDPMVNIRNLFDAFNMNMRACFSPSWSICVDESMVAWTSRGTLPNWVYVPRKPTPNGQEWHTLACSETRVIIAVDSVESELVRRYDNLGRMCGVVLRLCESAGLMSQAARVVVGDSAFPSIRLVKELRDRNLFSLFAIKKRRYWPKLIPGDKLLQATQALRTGESVAFESVPSQTPKCFLAGLKDINPCLIVSNCGSLVEVGDIVHRKVTTVAGSQRVAFRRPDVFDVFYKARHSVDDNNNLRQNTRSIEDTWQTKHWQHRSFAMLLGIVESNAFLTFQNFIQKPYDDMPHTKFRRELAIELLDIAPARQVSDESRGHFMESFKTNLKWFNNAWHTRPTGKNPQKRCARCRKRVKTFCICNPDAGMCRNPCFTHHVLDTA
jgi:hypothetical protein